MSTALAAATAVWLWAGIVPADIPAAVQTVYVYQGVIAEQDGVVRVERKGVHPHAGDARAIVPVVRFRGRPEPERVARELEALAASWEARGRRVPMVQVDRDVASRLVGEHAQFVAAVRRALNRKYALSVTALADWLVAADHASVIALARSADEIVFQLYHERHAVPQVGRFDAALETFEAPFKVGLLADMDLPPRAARSAQWRGSIVFLQRAEP